MHAHKKTHNDVCSTSCLKQQFHGPALYLFAQREWAILAPVMTPGLINHRQRSGGSTKACSWCPVNSSLIYEVSHWSQTPHISPHKPIHSLTGHTRHSVLLLITNRKICCLVFYCSWQKYEVQNHSRANRIDYTKLYFCYRHLLTVFCSMKIFCKFPTVNISKLNFWLLICIAKNFIWTTLKGTFLNI